MRNTLLAAVACLLPLQAADPTEPLFWSASQQKDFDKLGRFMLREDGRTVAIGLITRLYTTKRGVVKAE